MKDIFDGFAGGLESPATHVLAATPSDTADLTHASRAINVAGAGAVRVTTIGGTTGIVYVAAGVPFPIRATRIWQTGTTATGIAVLY